MKNLVIDSFKNWIHILSLTFKEFGKNRGSRMSAALAFYTVFSLAPLLISLVTLLEKAFKNKAVQEKIMETIYPYLGPQGVDLAHSIFERASNSPSGVTATLISFFILFFGASTIFVELKESINIIFGIDRKFIGAFLLHRVLGFLMVLATGIFLILSFVVSAIISGVTNFLNGTHYFPSFFLELTNFSVSLLLSASLFTLLFRYLPEKRIGLKTSFKGGLFTALLFSIGKSLIGYYLGKTAVTSLYGAAGTIVVFLIWIYYTSQIFFIGLEFCKVLAMKKGEFQMSSLKR